MKNHDSHRRPSRPAVHWLQLALLCTAVGAVAVAAVPALAETYIFDEPLATRSNTKAKPNLLFILDDSGSMAREYMPDEMSSTDRFGYYSAQCNGLAYDPSITYSAPINADRTSFPNASFTSAWSDGFALTGATNLNSTGPSRTAEVSPAVTAGTGSKTFSFTGSGYNGDLGLAVGNAVVLTSGGNVLSGFVTSWQVTGNASPYSYTLVVDVTAATGSSSATSWTIQKPQGSTYYTYSGAEPKMGWRYNSDDVIKDTFYNECFTRVSSGSTLFTPVKVYSSSPEATNYANWYSYYRTRTMLMRTAVGSAFKALDDSYRVGFTTIHNKDVTDSNGFQSVSDFDATQKSTIYSKLYAAQASGGTPLRAALSKAGRYYAKHYASQQDPVQYSCQRNYALLSTDGYWNNGGASGGVDVESGDYRALDLAGNMVGNQDGTQARPMYDGATTITTVTRTQYTVGDRKSCNSVTNGYRVKVQPQTLVNGIWSNNRALPDMCLPKGSVVTNDQVVEDLVGKTVQSPEVSNTTPTGGSSNTLADVAQYYYATDLRTTALGNCSVTVAGTTQNVCTNSLKPAGLDTATHQHMTTFTIGLGVSGTLTYDRNYLTQTTGDYVKLKAGTADWPVPTTNITGGSGDARNIDDLWHAAVNGRGQYYSALNATALREAIAGVVNTIQEEHGSSSAASTSSLELVAGENNQVYKASYTTKTWIGDVQAYTLNGDTAAIGSTPVWSAQSLLKARTYTTRRIFYRQPSSTTTLRTFDWTSLQADGLDGNFSGLCSKSVTSSQCSGLTASEAAVANNGANLVNFLRGDTTLESASTANSTTRAIYRTRAAVLGDIVNGAPVYVSKPPFNYTDTGYATFVAAQRSRKPMIYTAANDGMLHAFSAATADGGSERWAYVPTAVMSNMYRLADASYESRHLYLVDGAPVIGDIKVGTTWKTILVGGLNKGGRSYYALDITDPENPLPLWEFSHDNLGLSFGNPVITKRQDGTWVVVFSSGYNNVNPGDGQGRLFVLNANTGVRLLDIATGEGTTSNPAGMAKINAWIDDPSDNTSKRFYGGDLLGNLWRFDVDNRILPNQAALKLAKFQINETTPQPITTRPETIEISGKAVIIVGTGRYLGTDDISDATQNTLYAVKDPLTNTNLGDVRASNTMVRQTFTVTGNNATITNNPVNWSTKNGWWVDLPNTAAIGTAKERIVTDMALQFGTLSIGTAIPNGDACSSGGSSWRYYLNASDGTGLESVAGNLWSESSLIVGQSWVKLENGETRILRQGSDGTIRTERPPGGGGDAGAAHRVSWRELAN